MTIRSKAASSPLLKWTSKRHNKAEKPKNSRIRNGPGFSAPDGAAPLSHGRICSEFPVIQRMLHYSTVRCFSLFATETICTYRAIWLRGEIYPLHRRTLPASLRQGSADVSMISLKRKCSQRAAVIHESKKPHKQSAVGKPAADFVQMVCERINRNRGRCSTAG